MTPISRKDPQTGRDVRQLTSAPQGALIGYFRYLRNLPDGRVLAWSEHEKGNVVLLDPISGEMECIPLRSWYDNARLREEDGCLWYWEDRILWRYFLLKGQREKMGEAPAEVPGRIFEVSLDGEWVLLNVLDQEKVPLPTTMDMDKFWVFCRRKRSGELWSWNRRTGETRCIHKTDGCCTIHVDISPRDSSLVRFCHDMFECHDQRTWTVRTDGSDLRKIRPQARGEMITHEFWWKNGEQVGFTYQDRRNDPDMERVPMAEYSASLTQFGLADLSGKQTYLSDPLNCYHTHLYTSPDGTWLSGEGTHDHSFVYATPLDRSRTRVEFQTLATIHTPYVPFRGQNVDAGFTRDNRYLLFNDTVDGKLQIHAVKPD